MTDDTLTTEIPTLVRPTMRQIAHLCGDPDQAIGAVEAMRALGYDEWLFDEADLEGEIFDESGRVRDFETHAFMAFNYQVHAEHELEFLAYDNAEHYRVQLNGWYPHPDSPPRITHVSVKSDDSLRDGLALCEQLNTRIVCRFNTRNHTNPALIEQGRTFSETIVSTTHLLGYDVKFIQSVYR